MATSSANAVNSAIGRSPAIMTEMIGAASGSTLSTMGGSISAGNSARATCTLSRTSWTFSRALELRLNSIRICARPSLEKDCSVSIPSIVLMYSSRMSVTSDSMVSAEAPSSVAVTLTYGNSTSGNKSTPNRPIDIRPRPTKDAMSITANTARRIEISTSHIMRV